MTIDVENPAEMKWIDGFGESFRFVSNDRVGFLCDGKAGIRIADTSNPKSPVFLSFLKTKEIAYDCVFLGKSVFVADGGRSN